MTTDPEAEKLALAEAILPAQFLSNRHRDQVVATVAEALARAEAQVATLTQERDDARDTLDAWFAQRDRLREGTTEEMLSALDGYLRTSQAGGMPEKLADEVREVLSDFCRLDGVASLLHEAIRRAAKGENNG